MKEIKIAGCSTNIEPDDKLAIGLFGQEGTGKSRFAVTAPDPIGYVPLDRKARKTVKRVADELGKVIVMPDQDFIRTGNPIKLASMDEKTAKAYYRKHVDSIKHAAYSMYEHPSVRTIVIDTLSQVWEDMLFAEYGRSQRIMPRDRGAVNQEMVDFLNSLSGKNLILINKATEIWKNDKPTGKYEHVGFRHLGYHCNVMAEMVCDKNVKEAGEEGQFSMNIKLCQDNPSIQGLMGVGRLKDEMITFPYLAAEIYPDDDMERWM